MFGMTTKHRNGFTLIEMIMVILILGILSGILFVVLQGPIQSYIDVEKRTRLVDIADTALQRMTREIRLALPNSIRTTCPLFPVEPFKLIPAPSFTLTLTV